MVIVMVVTMWLEVVVVNLVVLAVVVMMVFVLVWRWALCSAAQQSLKEPNYAQLHHANKVHLPPTAATDSAEILHSLLPCFLNACLGISLRLSVRLCLIGCQLIRITTSQKPPADPIPRTQIKYLKLDLYIHIHIYNYVCLYANNDKIPSQTYKI